LIEGKLVPAVVLNYEAK